MAGTGWIREVNKLQLRIEMNDAFKLQIYETDDIFNSGLEITDDVLSHAQIAAYMYGQTIENSSGEDKPYNQKTFPEKAIDIMVVQDENNLFEIFLDSNAKAWDSRLKIDGKSGKLGPVQMEQFFNTDFYSKMCDALSKRWPLSDNTFNEYFNACVSKKMAVQPELA